jgi:dihydropteroate synthase
MISERHSISAFTFQIKGKILDLSSPVVMGILNITPDSFYAGSRLSHTDGILPKAGQMISEGASILDIGGQSTRPGSTTLEANEERDRVIPAIELLRKEFGHELWLSIDTFYASVAQEAVQAGADMVNDVSGGDLDQEMYQVVSQLKVPYVLMHMRGKPENMNAKAIYQDLLTEVIDELQVKITAAKSAGIEQIMIDPGFGFAKTVDQNFRLLSHLHTFQLFNLPILVGLSRKSMIWKTLESTADEALNGSTVLNTLALSKGIQVLRVHDVRPAMEAIQLVNRTSKA